ncbi:hypothetical protein BK718_33050 [Bacillus thuringiensis serovar andalousiensis]|uniref:hypothetical protein n=1 Tax=Bacillus cereus group TaxID=86661 RepID=UPI0006AC759F|nr:hypothetical protein [Bacillus thuringiensis]OTX19067.1 hypothetical protein BK718_33050 [Bacillus thuringiensis serovar andalousiensis]
MRRIKTRSVSKKIEGMQALFLGVLVTSSGLASLSLVATYETIKTVCGVTSSIAAIIFVLLLKLEDKEKEREK